MHRAVGFGVVEWGGFNVEGILGLVLGFVSEEVESAGAAFGAWFGEVQRIAACP